MSLFLCPRWRNNMFVFFINLRSRSINGSQALDCLSSLYLRFIELMTSLFHEYVQTIVHKRHCKSHLQS